MENEERKGGGVMKVLVFPVLAGLLLFAGCKKQEASSGVADGKSGEVSVAELQKRLDEALSK